MTHRSRSLFLGCSLFSVPFCAVLFTICFLSSSAAHAAEARTGEQIYKSKCAYCHGAAGEGVAKIYPNPLAGDRSVLELTKLISKTMPEDDPGSLSAEDSQRVSTFIYDAFYSATAQARNRPARIELSRLTVAQYHNALADIIASFRGPTVWGNERGLRGQYFPSRQFKEKERIVERVDPGIKFDFGEGPAIPDKHEPHEFGIRWDGSVLAPESGEYEIVVRTEHAMRLWLNETKTPLIDAWVKSGKGTEFRANIHLLAGRVYPLRMEFHKAKLGGNKAKNPPEPQKASIALMWKAPQGIEEMIPARYLSTKKSPSGFVSTTMFPPDDRSNGYEQATSISKAWESSTTAGAIEFAGYVMPRLDEFAGSFKKTGAEREALLKKFCGKVAQTAFRRPLTPEQTTIYIDRQFEKAPDPETAVKRVLLLVLKSPRFLYRELEAAGETKVADAYDVASRVSFGLWDSLPDAELLRAADAGQLATREQVAKQVDRMLGDLRTRAKLREFFTQWLKLGAIHDLSKDSRQFPQFTPEVASDLRASLEIFVEEIVWSEASDFRELLLSQQLPINGRLAAFLGAELPADAPFQNVARGAEGRAGVLTHPYLLASFAYTSSSSPIHRGVFISRSLLGRALRPPPEAVTPLPPETHAGLSTRERVALQTRGESCMTCHSLINPLGFTLENFDAVGRHRAAEQNKPVDTTGEYLTRSGQDLKFAGAKDLAKYLAESEETHTALVNQLFHNFVKQPIRAYGPDMSEKLRARFKENNFSVRRLVAEIVVSSAVSSAAKTP